MGGWLPSPGAFEACEWCGGEFPCQSLDRWHLVEAEAGDLMQVCSWCAVNIRERRAALKAAIVFETGLCASAPLREALLDVENKVVKDGGNGTVTS